MGIIIVKLIGREDSITINGDSIAYAEGGNVLEILNEDQEILAVYRNWEYAIVQESEEEYQRLLQADLDDDEEDEEDDLDDEDLEDDEELDDEQPEEEPSVDEEEAVQRAREVMSRAIANDGSLSMEEMADRLMAKHADARARLSGEDGAPTN